MMWYQLRKNKSLYLPSLWEKIKNTNLSQQEIGFSIASAKPNALPTPTVLEWFLPPIANKCWLHGLIICGFAIIIVI